jgi:Icc-related predicted phosphoesterase
MKILCVSDIEDAAVYNSEIKNVFPATDFIMCAGDLRMEYMDFIVSTLNVPAFFVFGNHHVAYQEKTEHGARHAGFTVLREKTKYGTLLVAGADGCMRYNLGACQFNEKEMKHKLRSLMPALLYNKLRYGRYLDIFLTHSPPEGINDQEDLCHRGFDCFKSFLNKIRPRYMLHGHIHLRDLNTQRIAHFEDTTIINVFGHYVLDFPDMQDGAPK